MSEVQTSHIITLYLKKPRTKTQFAWNLIACYNSVQKANCNLILGINLHNVFLLSNKRNMRLKSNVSQCPIFGQLDVRSLPTIPFKKKLIRSLVFRAFFIVLKYPITDFVKKRFSPKSHIFFAKYCNKPAKKNYEQKPSLHGIYCLQLLSSKG